MKRKDWYEEARAWRLRLCPFQGRTLPLFNLESIMPTRVFPWQKIQAFIIITFSSGRSRCSTRGRRPPRCPRRPPAPAPSVRTAPAWTEPFCTSRFSSCLSRKLEKLDDNFRVKIFEIFLFCCWSCSLFELNTAVTRSVKRERRQRCNFIYILCETKKILILNFIYDQI